MVILGICGHSKTNSCEEGGKMPHGNSVNWIKHWKASLSKTKNYLLKKPIVQVITRTLEESGDHDIGQRAAGVAYYAIISIFPLLLGLIAVFGFFLPSINLQNILLNFVGNNIPGATNIIKENIAGIIRLRGVMSVLSIVILFWGASALFGSISLAINRAWNVTVFRHFLSENQARSEWYLVPEFFFYSHSEQAPLLHLWVMRGLSFISAAK